MIYLLTTRPLKIRAFDSWQKGVRSERFLRRISVAMIKVQFFSSAL